MQVDSVLFELYLVEGHDDFVGYLSYMKDSIPGIIREFKRKIEQSNNIKYPYDHFMMVETPISFAAYFWNEMGGSEKVQPEMVFLPERGVGFRSMNLIKNIQMYQKIMIGQKMKSAGKRVLIQLLDDIFISEYDFTSKYTSFRELNPLMKLFMKYSFDNFTLRGNPFSLSPLFYNQVTDLNETTKFTNKFILFITN